MKSIIVIIAFIISLSNLFGQDDIKYIALKSKNTKDSSMVASQKNFLGVEGLRYHIYTPQLAKLFGKSYQIFNSTEEAEQHGFIQGLDVLGDTTASPAVLLKESLPFYPIF